MRENFSNFHTVTRIVWKNEKFSLTEKINFVKTTTYLVFSFMKFSRKKFEREFLQFPHCDILYYCFHNNFSHAVMNFLKMTVYVYVCMNVALIITLNFWLIPSSFCSSHPSKLQSGMLSLPSILIGPVNYLLVNIST